MNERCAISVILSPSLFICSIYLPILFSCSFFVLVFYVRAGSYVLRGWKWDPFSLHFVVIHPIKTVLFSILCFVISSLFSLSFFSLVAYPYSHSYISSWNKIPGYFRHLNAALIDRERLLVWIQQHLHLYTSSSPAAPFSPHSFQQHQQPLDPNFVAITLHNDPENAAKFLRDRLGDSKWEDEGRNILYIILYVYIFSFSF